jgi:hypothetical protein
MRGDWGWGWGGGGREGWEAQSGGDTRRPTTSIMPTVQNGSITAPTGQRRQSKRGLDGGAGRVQERLQRLQAHINLRHLTTQATRTEQRIERDTLCIVVSPTAGGHTHTRAARATCPHMRCACCACHRPAHTQCTHLPLGQQGLGGGGGRRPAQTAGGGPLKGIQGGAGRGRSAAAARAAHRKTSARTSTQSSDNTGARGPTHRFAGQRTHDGSRTGRRGEQNAAATTSRRTTYVHNNNNHYHYYFYEGTHTDAHTATEGKHSGHAGGKVGTHAHDSAQGAGVDAQHTYRAADLPPRSPPAAPAPAPAFSSLPRRRWWPDDGAAAPAVGTTPSPSALM